MSKWYQKSYRRSLVDMHIEAWNDEFLSQFDPETYVELLKKANIQSAMLYINSHVGYCYWPTKTGCMHPGFKGEDKMKKLFDLCHKAGMDVIVYYSLIYNNWAYNLNPSWRMLDRNGKASRENGGRYGLCCPNSQGYREFVFAQIKEFCQHFDFEGVFFDMTFWPMVCFCNSCKERYAKEVGGDIPTVIDWNNPVWVNFQKKREEWMSEFAEITTREMKKYKPYATVEHQYSTATQPWIRGVTEGISQASDYIGGDFYGGFMQQSFVCKLYYGLTRNQPFEYMTSRCYPNLRDHTTMKSREMIALHNYITMAHQGAFLIIDAIDPIGTMNPKVYELIGDVFEESKKYEPYLGGKFCKDVGIYFSLRAKMNPDVNGNDAIDPDYGVPHLDAAFGAACILKENHIPFGVVNNYKLEDLSKIKILILPDVVVMDETEKQAVKDFVQKGGSLYISGRTAPDLVAEMLGLQYEGRTEEDITYITFNDNGNFLISNTNVNYPLTIFGYQLKMSGASKEQILATITLPYTNPSESGQFASIHSNPPGINTEYPSVIYGSYGRGKVIWVAAPLEAAQQEPHRQVFVNMIRELATEPFAFQADGPGVAEITLFHKEEENRFLVSVVNIQEGFHILPVYNMTVRIRLDNKKPVRVVMLPSKKEIKFDVKNGYVEFKIDKLDIFKMFAVDYENK
ncbi:alpha-L-fucosidase [Caldicoprobacter algeriensis]|uniref:alpha-amylase family protein n=1 Tax=Caldicoprobacter algeriensis TaxID=699281 RepID=UPI002079FB75|nr:alpha-amylase family protein [Caldicoprobacter algeriensis]MCM8900060.1 alpha-L-fucosidase [Caldicoprobacter algeriensis]